MLPSCFPPPVEFEKQEAYLFSSNFKEISLVIFLEISLISLGRSLQNISIIFLEGPPSKPPSRTTHFNCRCLHCDITTIRTMPIQMLIHCTLKFRPILKVENNSKVDPALMGKERK